MRKTTIFVITALIAATTLLLAQQNFGVNRTKKLTLHDQVRIGSQVLPPGQYKIKHVMDGENHLMLFKNDRQEFRVNCTMSTLPQKAHDTRLMFSEGPSGRVLTGLIFEGDTFQHEFAQ
jgi:hypothetical protein